VVERVHDGLEAPTQLERTDDERFLHDWLIALEGWALFEAEIHRLPGFVTLAVGVEPDGDSVEGLSLVGRAFLRPSAFEEGRFELPTLEVPGAERIEFVRVTVEPWALRPHSDLRDGTLTCWVHLQDDTHALLTARHNVVSTAYQADYAPMDDTTDASLRWHSPNCLDASVLDPVVVPSTFESLTLRSLGVRGAVDVQTKRGAQRRKVELLNNVLGTTTSRVPHLFWLDSPLIPGDSGSRVDIHPSGEAGALYFAELVTPTKTYGLCQGLEQLAALFKTRHQTRGLCREAARGH
jgi:hypothetical protein